MAIATDSKTAPSRPAGSVSEEDRTWNRLRPQTLPLRLAVWPPAVVVTLWALDRLGQDQADTQNGLGLAWLDQGRMTLELTGLTAAAGILLLVGTAAVSSRITPQRWRKRLRVGAAVSGAWATLAVAAGPSWSSLAIYALTVVALAAQYWREVRIPVPGGPVELPTESAECDREPLEPAVETSVLEMYVDAWEQYAACDVGPLPGTKLIPLASTSTTHDFELHLVRGRDTYEKVMSLHSRLATALEVKQVNLQIEKVDAWKESILSLKILHQSVAEKNEPFTGPKLVDGVASIGPYADGEGEAPWRHYDGESAHSGMIIGATGLGKSRIAENIVCSITSDPLQLPTVVWFIDPQDGQSSPALQEYADWYGNLESSTTMLEALWRIAQHRQKQAAIWRHNGFKLIRCTCPNPIEAMTTGRHLPYPTKASDLGTPGFCAFRPIISVWIDEAHEVFDIDHNAALATTMARKIRKLGITLNIQSQYAGLESLGGQEPLRASIASGNGVIMNVASNHAGKLMPGLEGLDPRDLPHTPGYLYTLRRGDFGRTAPARNRLLVNPTTSQPDAAYWLGRHPRLTLDPVAAAAAGDAYRSRLTSLEDIAQAHEQEIADLLNGQPTPLLEPVPAPGADNDIEGGNATDPDGWPQAGDYFHIPTQGETAEDRIRNALANGITRVGHIAEVAGCTDVYVRRVLTNADWAEKVRHGTWQMTGN